MLPYPGRYESHDSWMRRCDEYHRDQARWRKQQAARHTNWGGYHYTPVAENIIYTLCDGTKIDAVKVGFGRRNSRRVKRWAQAHGLSYIQDSNGLPGICKRVDGVAFRDSKLDEVYSDDSH